jgi:hypothetical protein
MFQSLLTKCIKRTSERWDAVRSSHSFIIVIFSWTSQTVLLVMKLYLLWRSLLVDTKLLALVPIQKLCYHLVYLVFYLGTWKLGGLIMVNLSKALLKWMDLIISTWTWLALFSSAVCLIGEVCIATTFHAVYGATEWQLLLPHWVFVFFAGNLEITFSTFV